ncbi:hypothetical protein AB0C01_27900 [Micromonospora sp. NPDC048905]|uniref:hypothetical protein n=1 Tax=Micromonospora sp. NPDC048905 TaxID=3155494 RepID=UPI0033FFF8EB
MPDRGGHREEALRDACRDAFDEADSRGGRPGLRCRASPHVSRFRVRGDGPVVSDADEGVPSEVRTEARQPSAGVLGALIEADGGVRLGPSKESRQWHGIVWGCRNPVEKSH